MRALSPSPLMTTCTSYLQVFEMHVVFARHVLLYILSCVSDAGSDVRRARGGACYAKRHASRAAVLSCSYPHTPHRCCYSIHFAGGLRLDKRKNSSLPELTKEKTHPSPTAGRLFSCLPRLFSCLLFHPSFLPGLLLTDPDKLSEQWRGATIESK